MTCEAECKAEPGKNQISEQGVRPERAQALKTDLGPNLGSSIHYPCESAIYLTSLNPTFLIFKTRDLIFTCQ